MKLTENTILITGGTSGIGLAFAKKFVELNNTVIITGRNQQKMTAVLANNPKIIGLISDVSKAEDVRYLADTLKQNYPTLNLVINSAGIMRSYNYFDDSISSTFIAQEVNTNLLGTLFVTKALLPLLNSQPEAMLVNISSGLANLSYHATPTYSATKAGVHLFTDALRFQGARFNNNLHIIELVPPLVAGTALEANQRDNSKGMTTTHVVDLSLKGFLKNKKRINLGQSKLLRVMGKIAPDYFSHLIGTRTII